MPFQGTPATSFETAFRKEMQIGFQDIDVLGHVNNIVYLRWVQDIAVRHWNSCASPDIANQYIFVVLRHEIDYRDPLVSGDRAIVRTWLGKARGARFGRYVDIRKEGSDRFSAFAHTTWVMKDRGSGRPEKVTDDVIEAFGLDPDLARAQ